MSRRVSSVRRTGKAQQTPVAELITDPRTRPRVMAWLQRLAVPARNRPDVAQDVLLAAYLARGNFDPLRARPERWLNAIAVYHAAKYHDRALNRRELLAEAPELPPSESTPEGAFFAEEERGELLAAVLNLGEDACGIVVGFDLDLEPMVEVAARLGLPASTAYKVRVRALAELAVTLTRRRERPGRRA